MNEYVSTSYMYEYPMSMKNCMKNILKRRAYTSVKNIRIHVKGDM